MISSGISSKAIHLPASTSEAELLSLICSLNADDGVDGILVQLPLPNHISERNVCDTVAPWKDVDAFNVINVGRFCCDVRTMVPATPAGVIEMIRRTGKYSSCYFLSYEQRYESVVNFVH